MRKLILTILRLSDEPLGPIELMSIALTDDNADYFLFADALSGLTEAGLALRDGSRVSLTPKGAEVAAIVTGELPAALRRVVAEGCAAARDANFRARCVRAEAAGVDGTAYLSASLSDGTRPLLELRLQTSNQKQAEKLARRFEEKAEEVLQMIWEVLSV
ncbi:MAG: DUF4364 family protein [Oscillospiraceae bacterium]|nr:DUF4364 family protein [Oscillospiraceae bacterium]